MQTARESGGMSEGRMSSKRGEGVLGYSSQRQDETSPGGK